MLLIHERGLFAWDAPPMLPKSDRLLGVALYVRRRQQGLSKSARRIDGDTAYALTVEHAEMPAIAGDKRKAFEAYGRSEHGSVFLRQ